MHNVIGNSLKYTPKSGKVTIAVKSDGRTFSMNVSDSGIGISVPEQEMIFEKFYRSKDPRVAKITGSGLGLALAREIARLHEGDITVKSEVDQGSTFTITLPVPQQAA